MAYRPQYSDAEQRIYDLHQTVAFHTVVLLLLSDRFQDDHINKRPAPNPLHLAFGFFAGLWYDLIPDQPNQNLPPKEALDDDKRCAILMILADLEKKTGRSARTYGFTNAMMDDLNSCTADENPRAKFYKRKLKGGIEAYQNKMQAVQNRSRPPKRRAGPSHKNLLTRLSF